jgi:hypothetical protein
MVKLHPTHIANVTREPLMYLYMGHKAKPKEIIRLIRDKGISRFFQSCQIKDKAIRIEEGGELEEIQVGER